MGDELAIASATAAVVGGVLVLMRVFSSQVYDVIIIRMTRTWYKAVMDRLDANSRVLDVGIGTATALLRNKDLLDSKKMNFVGVDYDQAYIAAAKAKVHRAGASDQIQVLCKSIFDGDLKSAVREADKSGRADEPFDAAYFSGSWTLMPNPVRALRIAARFVKDDGKLYVTQTFQRQSTPMLGFIKPLLKYVTTIDFGQLHYEKHLDEYLAEAAKPVDGWKLVAEENSVIPNSIDNAYQAARLVVFKKVPAEK
ncbi:Hypothetical Protein FCC1311_059452 [Hondaea fermentalgiana]|uniref:Methyltransferase domain-containing protein n=1 Tax=Hondaea fermentalgiana TaxID=2315210 RepID=A0A2R5GPC3_9STRA|nr:Hypothetical Protein FCC1311_059452 [Hondaea fermentalgiana]|eukprot:GBG29724.1 Hypothetical Protein FCC1311_059452 [Hondaea fermentalgiana]